MLAPHLGEAPEQPRLIGPLVGGVCAPGGGARHLPGEQIRAALPVADRAQQALRRGGRLPIGRRQPEHREPGVGRVAGVGADVRLLAQHRDVAQQRQPARAIGRVIERSDGERQRFDRPSGRFQPRAGVVQHRGRTRKFGQRHHPDVERALRLARRLEQFGLLGQDGQPRVAQQRAGVLLQGRRQLARAPERPEQPRALSTHAHPFARRRFLERAFEHGDRANHIPDRLELRREPPPESGAARRFVFVGVRAAQQLQPAVRRVLAARDADHQLLGERERRVGARMARERLLEQREHARRIIVAARQQPLRGQIVIGRRLGFGLARDRR